MQFEVESTTLSAACPALPIVSVANPPLIVLLWQTSQDTVPVGTWLETSFIAPLVPVPWQL